MFIKHLEINHEVIPILNKIVDLPASDIEKLKKLRMLLELKQTMQFLVQAKLGEGVDDILEAIINKLPAQGDQMIKSSNACS